MALEEYRAKRDFRKTSEPAPHPAEGHKQPIFVVQEHHASRLHYDFRLEVDGVLKSWAVPKEPSMDPVQKRLAVHVEDHPLDYAAFEGTIPEGEYGAGTVRIWDHGTYENLLADKPEPQTVAQAIMSGHVEIMLNGEKLKGRFALIRMQGGRFGKKDNWLLIKMKDEFAHADAEAEQKPEKPKTGRQTRAAPAPRRRTTATRVSSDEVALTNPDKIMFPDAGLTKADVFDYYRKIAEHLLPYLQDRPVTLERLPDGIGDGKPHFWQKNTPSHYPDWIPRVELKTEDGKQVNYTLVNDERTLLYLVNQGALTFHVWFSRVADLNRPDFVLFDLDRSQATFQDVVEVAQAVHAILDSEETEAFIKTTGKSGLHVLVPWQSAGGYDEARGWAETIAAQVVKRMPDQATMERSKAKRGRHVYVDVMQNARGRHAVPPYVLRPLPGAPVSTPLNWRELTADLDPADFNLKTIFRRLEKQKSDPMAPLLRAWAPTRKAGRRHEPAAR